MERSLLSLLQLVSPALPVGAYSYSEGLETLCHSGAVKDAPSLKHWLERELYCGAVRLEAAVMLRAYWAVKSNDLGNLTYWNNWLSAARETEELRLQSWQMGYSLLRLLQDMQIAAADEAYVQLIRSLQRHREASGCNFAIAFGLAASTWGIAAQSATLGYLHSWVANLVSAGVKLIPLGQTVGQQLIASLHAEVSNATLIVQDLEDDDLQSCGWGLALASMAHETQYSRLFRS